VWRLALLVALALALCPVPTVGAPEVPDVRATEWPAAERGSIDAAVLDLAMAAAACALRSGAVGAPSTLTVIDYSRPSSVKRLWVYDLVAERLLFEELVSHGQGSGGNLPTEFSNQPITSGIWPRRSDLSRIRKRRRIRLASSPSVAATITTASS
jgi:hypothetical protein